MGVERLGRERRRDHLAARRRGWRLVVTRYASVLDLIGQTPVVDVSALSPKSNVAIFAKLEGRNPAGSVKDRVALSLVEAAEREGRLVPGEPEPGAASSRPRATPASRSPSCAGCAAITSRSCCRPTSRPSAASSSTSSGPRSSTRREPKAQTVRCASLSAERMSNPGVGLPLPVRQPGQSRRRTTTRPDPRSWPTSPRSPTSSRDSALRARSWASVDS